MERGHGANKPSPPQNCPIFGEKEDADEGNAKGASACRLRRRTKCLMMGCGGQLRPIMYTCSMLFHAKRPL